jgi:hypothetical protein
MNTRHRLRIGMALIGLVCLAPFSVGGGQKSDPPKKASKFLVLPYLQLPTPDAITIMWETDEPSPGRVEYGSTRELGSVVDAPKSAKLHEVRLQGLKTGTKYFYRVSSDGLQSDIFHFRTAPEPGTKRWRMAVYGDSRSNPEMHRKVAQQVEKANVDLIVHTGDIVLDGREYDSWRQQFFEPLRGVSDHTPWVSTIGNHERDSANYFSYMALPGNERFFGFDYANAHIICLDSNTWIERGRDSKQYEWLVNDLKQKRPATWTFVAFHHPLLSAHANRPINSLRWDWAPVFLDPANRVDGVLTGHDHFYARNYRMGYSAEKPQAGVLFLTSAGGGASLYPTKQRDYVAKEKSVHHFTLFDFDGDRVTLTPIDIDGNVFDRYELTKKTTPPEEYCVYEVEELREFLRKALTVAPAIPLSDGPSTRIDTAVEVPTRFHVPVSGKLIWEETEGWKVKQPETPFHLKPNQPLTIPLRAVVTANGITRSPRLEILFEEGKFANRSITVYPFKLAGPGSITVAEGEDAAKTEWMNSPKHSLLPTAPYLTNTETGATSVRFAADGKNLVMRAELKREEGKAGPTKPGSDLILFQDHVRLVVWDGKQLRNFAVTPEGIRYSDCDKKEDTTTAWDAHIAREKGSLVVTVSVPRDLFSQPDQVRLNVVDQRQIKGAKKKAQRRTMSWELCPAYRLGIDPDVIPDWNYVPQARSTETADKTTRHFASLAVR